MNHRSTTITARVILVAATVFMFAPLIIVVVNSFNQSAFGAWPPPGFSLQWYRNLLHQDAFGTAAINSLIVSTIAMVASVLLGSLAALGLTRYRFRGVGVARGLLRAPMIVPHVAIGLAGFILLLRLDLYGTLHGLTVAHTIFALPFVVTILSAALLRVDRAQEQAAADLGARPPRVFWSVTLPQIRSALIAAALFGFITSFDELDGSLFMAPSDKPTLPITMYLYLENHQDPTLAALSTVLMVGTFVLGAVIFVLFGLRGVGDLFGGKRGSESPQSTAATD